MTVHLGGSNDDVIWELAPELQGATVVSAFVGFLNHNGVLVANDYASLWRWSVDNAEAFWSHWANFMTVELGGKSGAVRTDDPMPKTRWFPNRTLNYAGHLLNHHHGVAIVERSENGDRREISFEELRQQVGSLAAHLRDAGVETGDRVVAILSNVSEAIVGLLATASLGAIWSVCAPEFGAGAIASRLKQLEAKVLIATPGYAQGGKDRDRAEDVAAVADSIETLEQIIWVTRHTKITPPATRARSIAWEAVMEVDANLTITPVEFNHPLWVLFSSGTTGIPKGIVHSHGGALLEELKLAAIHNDVHANDRVLIVASTSWVVWNGLVACLGVGASIVLVDGSPMFPREDRIWQIVAEEKVNVLGLSAAYIHTCLKQGMSPNGSHDLRSLRVVSSTGSPLTPEGYRWVYEHVGDVWLTSQSGGTDIASIFVGGVPTLPVRPGFLQAPALGVNVQSWSEAGERTPGKGELVVTSPLPSMPLFFWGDEDGSRYHDSYFDTYPGVWRHGDFIEFTERGVVIHGRSDSTLNRNGLRLGTADLYAVVEALPEVQEALVIGVEEGTDYFMPLFVKKSESASEDQALLAIDVAIRSGLSARYLPDVVYFVSGIPHTKTGKKLEVPVKRLFQGAAIGDVLDPDAIDDYRVIEEFTTLAQARTKQF